MTGINRDFSMMHAYRNLTVTSKYLQELPGTVRDTVVPLVFRLVTGTLQAESAKPDTHEQTFSLGSVGSCSR